MHRRLVFKICLPINKCDFLPKDKRIDLTDIEIERLRGEIGRGSAPAEKIAAREEEMWPTAAKKGDTELFVKIDEHRAVAQQILAVKRDIKALSEALATIARAEKTKSEAIEKLSTTLGALDQKLRDIDTKLAPPPELEIERPAAAPSKAATEETTEEVELSEDLAENEEELRSEVESAEEIEEVELREPETEPE